MARYATPKSKANKNAVTKQGITGYAQDTLKLDRLICLVKPGTESSQQLLKGLV